MTRLYENKFSLATAQKDQLMGPYIWSSSNWSAISAISFATVGQSEFAVRSLNIQVDWKNFAKTLHAIKHPESNTNLNWQSKISQKLLINYVRSPDSTLGQSFFILTNIK